MSQATAIYCQHIENGKQKDNLIKTLIILHFYSGETGEIMFRKTFCFFERENPIPQCSKVDCEVCPICYDLALFVVRLIPN